MKISTINTTIINNTILMIQSNFVLTIAQGLSINTQGQGHSINKTAQRQSIQKTSHHKYFTQKCVTFLNTKSQNNLHTFEG